ncbi:MAG: hypothetical protein HFE44_17090 [Oscillospiraceae bacterium]|jgi:hypothetical protein|nr:hypothetical protein [Oscillospiraceae bacterium]
MTNNPFIEERQKRGQEIIRIGTVEAVEGSSWTIKWDGEGAPMDTTYSRVASYTPAAGDRVVGIQRASTYVILGKLVH